MVILMNKVNIWIDYNGQEQDTLLKSIILKGLERGIFNEIKNLPAKERSGAARALGEINRKYYTLSTELIDELMKLLDLLEGKNNG